MFKPASDIVPCAHNADKLSPFKFYQYFLTSVTDGEVLRFLRMLTFLPLEVPSAAACFRLSAAPANWGVEAFVDRACTCTCTANL